MRAFIAIELDKECVNEIIRIQKLIMKKTLFTGKLTESQNLHLTLKFLGEISEEQVIEAKKRLSLIKFNEFFAESGEVGVFSPDFVKIIWVKLNGSQNLGNFGTSKTKGFESKKIWELQKEIDEKLKDLFPIEARFMSHITIARVKYVKDRNGFLEYLKSVKPKKIKFLIKGFSLKKSELQSGGPVYRDIENYKLISKKQQP